jgi:hypothetical protein
LQEELINLTIKNLIKAMLSFCNHRAVNNKIMRANDYEEDKESNEEPEIKEVQHGKEDG